MLRNGHFENDVTGSRGKNDTRRKNVTLEPKIKNLIVCGVEGSGHHALSALLKSAKPDLFSIHVDGDIENQNGNPFSDVMLHRIAEENKAWDRKLEIPGRIARFVGLPRGLTLVTSAQGNTANVYRPSGPKSVAALTEPEGGGIGGS